MHFEWNGTFDNRCFERRSPEYDSLAYFFSTLLNGVPGGLCSCILVLEGFYEYDGPAFGYVHDVFYSKMMFCGRVLPYTPPRPDGSRETIEVKMWQEYGAVTHHCGYTISS